MLPTLMTIAAPWVCPAPQAEPPAAAPAAAAQAKEAPTPADRLEAVLGGDFTDARIRRRAETLARELLADHPRDRELREVAATLGRALAPLPERPADPAAEDAAAHVKRLITFAASGSRPVQEAVLQELVGAAPREVLLEACVEATRSKNWRPRAFALTAMGRLFPGDDPRRTLLHSIYDPSEHARDAAARAIGDIGVYEVAQPIVNALYASKPEIRARAIEALASARHPAFVEPLLDRMFMLQPPAVAGFIPKPAPVKPAPAGGASSGGPVRGYIFVGRQQAYIQDFEVEVAQFASVADPVINTLMSGSVLEVGVIGVSEVTVAREVRMLRRAVKRITGQQVKGGSDDWHSWWHSDDAAPFRKVNDDERARRARTTSATRPRTR